MYANFVGHTNCIFFHIAGTISNPVLMFSSVTSSSIPQDRMKYLYSHDIYSILGTVVDAKGWVEDGRGLLFVHAFHYKNNFIRTTRLKFPQKGRTS